MRANRVGDVDDPAPNFSLVVLAQVPHIAFLAHEPRAAIPAVHVEIPAAASIEQRMTAEIDPPTGHDDSAAHLEIERFYGALVHYFAKIRAGHKRHRLADSIGAAIPAASRVALRAAPDALPYILPLNFGECQLDPFSDDSAIPAIWSDAGNQQIF